MIRLLGIGTNSYRKCGWSGARDIGGRCRRDGARGIGGTLIRPHALVLVVRIRRVKVPHAVPPQTPRIGRVERDVPQRIIVFGIRRLALLELDDIDGICDVLPEVGLVDHLEDRCLSEVLAVL